MRKNQESFVIPIPPNDNEIERVRKKMKWKVTILLKLVKTQPKKTSRV